MGNGVVGVAAMANQKDSVFWDTCVCCGRPSNDERTTRYIHICWCTSLSLGTGLRWLALIKCVVVMVIWWGKAKPNKQTTDSRVHWLFFDPEIPKNRYKLLYCIKGLLISLIRLVDLVQLHSSCCCVCVVVSFEYRMARFVFCRRDSLRGNLS